MKELFALNIEDLIESKSVESLRIEYKSELTEQNKWSIIDTISAFANDLQNQFYPTHRPRQGKNTLNLSAGEWGV